MNVKGIAIYLHIKCASGMKYTFRPILILKNVVKTGVFQLHCNSSAFFDEINCICLINITRGRKVYFVPLSDDSLV